MPPGTLYVVATPLGNLEDLSPRARRVLQEVDRIACEDTRRTRGLLSRHGVRNRLISCHKFNERERLEPILAVLRDGGDVALVSDAGTPGVSDPGALLVRAAHDEGLRVCPVPGPSAVAALLSASGLDASRYVFDGFLPHRGGERRKRLRELRDDPRVIVIFETPHRIAETLGDIERVLGPRRVVLGRELSKRHESILSGGPVEVAEALGATVRGEITLAIAPAVAGAVVSGREPELDRAREVWRSALEESGGRRRHALRLAARRLGLERSALQRLLDEIGD